LTKRILVAVALITCFLATTACETILGPSESQPPLPENPPFLSQPYDMQVEGAPNLNLITVKGGYYIWKDGNSWHVRLARTDTQPRNFPDDVFTGTIRVEGGYITNVETQNVQFPDDMRPDPGNILYRFEIQRDVKGINFRVRPVISEYCITFDVHVNGLANPEFIRLGSAMVVPDTVPLQMCFRP
jgi:hypothetical protein